MYGRVKISLDDSANAMTVPFSAVFLDRKTNKKSVFVVKNGTVQSTPVEIGQDDGKTVQILSGLSADDYVVRHPAADLTDNATVEMEVWPEPRRPAGRRHLQRRGGWFSIPSGVKTRTGQPACRTTRSATEPSSSRLMP